MPEMRPSAATSGESCGTPAARAMAAFLRIAARYTQRYAPALSPQRKSLEASPPKSGASAAAHVRTEETVCLLLPEQEPAAVDVHEHRQGFLCLARAEYVHPVTGPAIAHVVRVRREEHVLRERICRVVPREKALELLLLLRRLGADHFFQHICRCLSWDFP